MSITNLSYPTESSFILYNYARICVLLNHFDRLVTEKMFPPLPPIEKIDFSLLKHEASLNIFVFLAPVLNFFLFLGRMEFVVDLCLSVL